ncbi:ABC transporter permease, partial [Bradyrhizobium diazoefficiens]
VVYGARASLLAGLISVAIALGVGVPLGLLAGYRGGFVDALISRITDAMLACPFLILAIALAAFLGPSLGNAMIAIGISATPIFIRLTRGQVLSVKAEDYVEAARAL